MKSSHLWGAVFMVSALVACSSDEGDDSGGTPSDTTECAKTCTKALAAGCENDTKDTCVSDCEQTEEKISENCKDNYSGLVACVELNGTYTCGNDGKAKLSGCDLMQNALVSCLQGAGGQGGSAGQGAGGQAGTAGQNSGGAGGVAGAAGEGAGGEPVTDITDSAECKQYCDAMAAECNSTCYPSVDCAIDAGQCAESERTYLACLATTGTWYCGSDGFSISSNCKRDNSVCPTAEPLPVSCDPESGDNSCMACAKASCCSAYVELFQNPDADPLLDCIDSCPTSGCYATCEHDYPEAWNALIVLEDCVSEQCAWDCQ